MNRKDLPKANTACETCGAKYYRCAKCIKFKSAGIETWRYHCDCAECYDLYMTVTLLESGKAPNPEAELTHLTEIKLPDGKKVTDSMKDRIKAILKQSKKAD